MNADELSEHNRKKRPNKTNENRMLLLLKILNLMMKNFLFEIFYILQLIKFSGSKNNFSAIFIENFKPHNKKYFIFFGINFKLKIETA